MKQDISWPSEQFVKINRGTLFVGNNRPKYSDMLKKADKANENDFSYSQNPPGIWVPLSWYQ